MLLFTMLSQPSTKGTLAFVDEPIGVAAADMYSFLTLVQDDPTVQIVSDAQIANVKAKLPAALKGCQYCQPLHLLKRAVATVQPAMPINLCKSIKVH